MLSSLSFVLLAYNEEKVIAAVVSKAAAEAGKVAGKYEVIVVCYEGATDNTVKIVEQLAARDRKIRIVLQPASQKGYGVALRMGIESARFDYVFYTDADNQFDISELPGLLPFIGEYDIVSGYRLKRQDPFGRILTAKVYRLLLRLLFGLRMMDVDSAFKIYKRRIFNTFKIRSVGGLVDGEILIKARNKGFRIKEVPVNHYPRLVGKSNYGTGFIKLSVVISVLKEMISLWQELRRQP